jgi:hypothetical protein
MLAENNPEIIIPLPQLVRPEKPVESQKADVVEPKNKKELIKPRETVKF